MTRQSRHTYIHRLDGSIWVNPNWVINTPGAKRQLAAARRLAQQLQLLPPDEPTKERAAEQRED